MKKTTLYKILALVLIVGLCAAFLPAFAAEASAASGVGTLVDADGLFTARDTEASPELGEAQYLSVGDGQTLTIGAAGVYVISGSASEAVILVDAEDAKVQLVLDGVEISNSDFPCIYVKSADKVFVTTLSDSSLTVSSGFRGDGETNTDGAIYSKDDLVLNGAATLTISSSANGIVSKDDLKLCSGSYVVTAAGHALEGRDSVRIASGSFILTAGKDGVHADNDEDAEKGWIYIAGGDFTIKAADDGVHAQSFVQIDGGSFSISAAEGVESTYVLINDGKIAIRASDDGLNAANKSSAYRATVEINGGEIDIEMGAGDTDGVDANGELIINGGMIAVTGGSCFDVDGTVSFNGGTVYVNGSQVSTIPVQTMGGMSGGPGGMGGMPGGMGGMPGGWGGMGGAPDAVSGATSGTDGDGSGSNWGANAWGGGPGGHHGV